LDAFLSRETVTTVKDIMTKNVVSIGVYNSIFEAAELMSSSQVGCLVIKDGEGPIGIVTERDIVRRVVAKEILSEGSWRKKTVGHQDLGDYVQVSHIN
jgi:predicted transcriptional regulator